MKTPEISVLIPSYNHGRFIGKAIETVLNQTYENFELIIFDDCSTDNSRSVIDSFDDSRIIKFFSPKNLGAVEALKKLSSMARGQYIAVLNSDDYWAEDKLSLQLEYLKENREVLAAFTYAACVDEKGNILTEIDVPYAYIFYQNNRSRREWIKDFLTRGNCLCHPSVLIRTEIYRDRLQFNHFYRQLPDFDLWLQLLKLGDIYVFPETLTYHRRVGELNTSAATPENAIRDMNELENICSQFISSISAEEFICIFDSCLDEKCCCQDKSVEKLLLLQKLSEQFNHLVPSFLKEVFSLGYNEKIFIDVSERFGLQKLFKTTAVASKCIETNNSKERQLLPQNEISQLRKENSELRRQFDELLIKNNESVAFIDSLLNSNSWKITRPLRAIKEVLK